MFCETFLAILALELLGTVGGGNVVVALQVLGEVGPGGNAQVCRVGGVEVFLQQLVEVFL